MASAERGSLRPGDRIGPYRLESRRADGAAHEMFRAVDVALGRRVTLEVAPASRGEVRSSIRVVHPNVLTELDHGAHRGWTYRAFELVEGWTAAELRARGPLPWPAVVRIMHGVVQALLALHRAGHLQRAVHPANVLVGLDGIVRLAELGFARPPGEDDSSVDTSSVIALAAALGHDDRPEPLRSLLEGPASLTSLAEALSACSPGLASEEALTEVLEHHLPAVPGVHGEAGAAVRRALAAGHGLVAVVGGPGIGKSRLVHEKAAGLPVRTFDLHGAWTSEVARRLGEALELSTPPTVPRVVAALAREGRVVLDGLDARGPFVEGLLGALAKHPDLRTVVTTREAPAEGELILLVPLTTEDTRTLLAAANPSLSADTIERAVSAAAGVPGVAQLVLRATELSAPLGEDVLAGALRRLPLLAPLLRAMVCTTDLEREAIEALVPASMEPLLRALSLGLVRERRPRELLAQVRFGLVPSVRTAIRATLTEADWIEGCVQHLEILAPRLEGWAAELDRNPAAETERDLQVARDTVFEHLASFVELEDARRHGLLVRCAIALARVEALRDEALLEALRTVKRSPLTLSTEAELDLAIASITRDHAEARALLTAIGEPPPGATWATRLRSLRADVERLTGRVEQAIERAEDALAHARGGPPADVQRAMFSLARARFEAGHFEAGEACLRALEHLTAEREDARGEAQVALLQASLAAVRGEATAALRACERAREVALVVGSDDLEAVVALTSAGIAEVFGRDDLARASYLEASRAFRAARQGEGHAQALLGLATLELVQTRMHRAHDLAREARALFQQLVDPIGESFALAVCAGASAMRGDLHAASGELTRASIAVRTGDARSQQVVSLWAGFLEIAVNPDARGLDAARARLGRTSLPPGPSVNQRPLPEHALVHARRVLAHRVTQLEELIELPSTP